MWIVPCSLGHLMSPFLKSSSHPSLAVGPQASYALLHSSSTFVLAINKILSLISTSCMQCVQAILYLWVQSCHFIAALHAIFLLDNLLTVLPPRVSSNPAEQYGLQGCSAHQGSSCNAFFSNLVLCCAGRGLISNGFSCKEQRRLLTINCDYLCVTRLP